MDVPIQKGTHELGDARLDGARDIASEHPTRPCWRDLKSFWLVAQVSKSQTKVEIETSQSKSENSVELSNSGERTNSERHGWTVRGTSRPSSVSGFSAPVSKTPLLAPMQSLVRSHEERR